MWHVHDIYYISTLKRLIRATKHAVNRASSSAVPVAYTQVCHMLMRLCILELVIRNIVGKDHQVNMCVLKLL